MQNKKTKKPFQYILPMGIALGILFIVTAMPHTTSYLGRASLLTLTALAIIVTATQDRRAMRLYYKLQNAENDHHTIVDNFIRVFADPSAKCHQIMMPQLLYSKAIQEFAQKGTPLERTKEVLNEITLSPGGSAQAIYKAIEQLDPIHLELLLKKGNTDTNYTGCNNFSFLHKIISLFPRVERSIPSRTDNTRAEDFMDAIRVLITDGINRGIKNSFDGETALEMFDGRICSSVFKTPQIIEITRLLDPDISLKELNLEIKRNIAESETELEIPIKEIETPKDKENTNNKDPNKQTT